MALIVDLSNNNAEPDWPTLARHTQGVWLKATEGLSFNDPFFRAWQAKARKAGLHVGGYHFARLGDPAAEARHFCSIIGKPKPGDLRPVLDLELPGPGAEQYARAFNREVRKRLNLWPVFYSYSAYIEALHLTVPIGGGLWLAAYSRNDGTEHPVEVPKPWKRLLAHQFSSRARVAGCHGLVDLSHAAQLSPLLVK